MYHIFINDFMIKINKLHLNKETFRPSFQTLICVTANSQNLEKIKSSKDYLKNSRDKIGIVRNSYNRTHQSRWVSNVLF